MPSSLASVKVDSGYADSFLSGVLAAVIASPCTAPFMGAAYWIPAFWVPALLVTHYVTFLLLLKHWRSQVGA